MDFNKFEKELEKELEVHRQYYEEYNKTIKKSLILLEELKNVLQGKNYKPNSD